MTRITVSLRERRQLAQLDQMVSSFACAQACVSRTGASISGLSYCPHRTTVISRLSRYRRRVIEVPAPANIQRQMAIASPGRYVLPLDLTFARAQCCRCFAPFRGRHLIDDGLRFGSRQAEEFGDRKNEIYVACPASRLMWSELAARQRNRC